MVYAVLLVGLTTFSPTIVNQVEKLTLSIPRRILNTHHIEFFYLFQLEFSFIWFRGGGGYERGPDGLRSVDGAGRMMEGSGRMLEGSGRMLEGSGRMMDGSGRMMEGSGRMMEGSGQMLEGSGRMLEGSGRMMDGSGRMMEGAGRLEVCSGWKDYEAKRLLASKAKSLKPTGEERTPTQAWAGLGFSSSMPDAVLR